MKAPAGSLEGKDVLIVGAGPYGIAVAQSLWERGIAFRIHGDPFSQWLSHTPEAMALCTDWRISEIYSRDSRYSLNEYLTHRSEGKPTAGGRLPAAVFRDYLRHVLRRLPFEIQRERIQVVERDGNGFRALSSASRELRSRAVVIATGLGPHRYLPAALQHLPAGRVLHSWDVRGIERLRGCSVLVIGAGQSAAEAVGQLRTRNRVTWSLRHKPRFRQGPLCVPKPMVKPVLALSHRLPGRLRSAVSVSAGRAKVTPDLAKIYADSRVEKVFGDAAEIGLREVAGRLVGTAGVPFDRVVAATGYRPAAAGIPFLATDLVWTLRNRPRLESDFQSAVPGLYLVGAVAEPSFGPAMRLIYGSRLAARRVGESLARELA